jgi:hypothetical protein
VRAEFSAGELSALFVGCPVETRPFILLAGKKKQKKLSFTKYLSMAEGED